MKKVFLFLGMLLSLGIFSACSNSDEIDTESSDVFSKITPIDDGDGFDAISAFFKTAFATEDEKAFNFKNNLSNKENPCIIINNEEDFNKTYTGDLNLPEIDFSRYTIVIGKAYLAAGTFIDNMSISQPNSTKTILSTKAILHINCIIDTTPGVGYVGTIGWVYYWKLFPKFHASKIYVEISREYGEVDKSKRQ